MDPNGGPGPSKFPSAPAPKRRKASVIAVSVLAGVVALAVAATGLALTDTWPFRGLVAGSAWPGQPHTAGGAEEPTAVTFADGIEAKWSLQGSDLHPDGIISGQIPRMLGLVNERSRPDQPIQLDSGVLLNYLTREGRGEIPPTWAFLDAETGEVLWEKEGSGYPTSCAASPDGAEAACSTSFVDDSQLLIGFDGQGVQFEEPADRGSVRYAGSGIEVLSEESIAEYSEDGTHLGSTPVAGTFAGSVDNASFPDCVWLQAAGQVSYVGTGCDAPDNEILAPDTGFFWSVAGGDDPLFLLVGESGLSAYDPGTRARLWNIDGYLPGNRQPPQLVEQSDELGVLVQRRDDSAGNFVIVGLHSGMETVLEPSGGLPHEPGSVAVVAGNEVLVFEGDSTVSSAAVYDGATGVHLSTVNFPAVAGVVEISGGPLGVLLAHPKCTDCTTAEGSHVIESYTFLGPVRGESRTAAQRVADVTVPGSIPAQCPADTVLLAWSELPDGWVLVCGITIDQPSYLVYQPAQGAQKTYSSGATRPTSAAATSALRWDERLNRYTAQMADGSVLTLDYDIGTLTVRDSADERTSDQQRLVRYVFVVIGSDMRTVEDAAREAGAFAVQAPGESAEDQIRYMIEVLEKAYAGRALVKDALPKLENCTASAGGYGDSIAAMQAVRDNRAELIEALDAMPVDRIPQGQRLLDELVNAIRHSHTANLEYVAWAESANATGCATLSATGKASAKASDGPKEAFAALWNSAVATQYGVRTFEAGHI